MDAPVALRPVHDPDTSVDVNLEKHRLRHLEAAALTQELLEVLFTHLHVLYQSVDLLLLLLLSICQPIFYRQLPQLADHLGWPKYLFPLGAHFNPFLADLAQYFIVFAGQVIVLLAHRIPCLAVKVQQGADFWKMIEGFALHPGLSIMHTELSVNSKVVRGGRCELRRHLASFYAF